MKHIYPTLLLLFLSIFSLSAEETDEAYSSALRHLKSTKDSAKVMSLAEKDIRSTGSMIPVKKLNQGRFFYLRCGDKLPTFEQYLSRYVQVLPITLYEMKKLRPNDVLILSYTHQHTDVSALIQAGAHLNTIAVAFGEKTNFVKRKLEEAFTNVVYTSSDSYFSQIAAAERIFAGDAKKPIRLLYGYPEQVGMSQDSLNKIDTLLSQVVSSGAAPGAHVLVARHGRVVYDRYVGTTAGDDPDSRPVEGDMIYDMASVTKVMATLPFVMKMYEEGKIKLTDRLGDVMPKFKGTNKENMVLADILTHRAGLKAWIPFYLQTLDSKTEPLSQYYRNIPTDGFSHKVVDGMYAIDSITDTIDAQMIASPVKNDKKYVYSDFAFFIFRQMSEQFYGLGLDSLVQKELYRPLGAWRSGYNPLKRFPNDIVVPSEKDTYWRHTTVQGYVHDMAAAFLDGVSGHAGLFSTADDMAKMSQMYLWGGVYGGERFLKKETIDLFSSCYYCNEGNYRGLGFDRPSFSNTVMGAKTFGHTGFTGTAIWIDPEADMVYIFLSNRTYQSMNNNILSSGGYRSSIQEICYKSIIDK
ncbi:MAG: serine hydrolase [Flavobacteriales bacterium]|nr:serine hydrolase [Flavobacteriales bacterium]